MLAKKRKKVGWKNWSISLLKDGLEPNKTNPLFKSSFKVMVDGFCLLGEARFALKVW